MATLLEQGIAAAKKNDNLRARQLLTQVLNADNHSERAWLWLSQVVSTQAERVQCLEQVVHINPKNTAARKALQQLVTPALPPLVTPSKLTKSGPDTGPVKVIKPSPEATERRPFRLQPETSTQPNGVHQPATVGVAPSNGSTSALHHQATTNLEPRSIEQATASPSLDTMSLSDLPSDTPSLPIEPLLDLSPKVDQAQTQPEEQPQKRLADQPEDFPFAFVIICGTLMVTALGGAVMLVVLAFSSWA